MSLAITVVVCATLAGIAGLVRDAYLRRLAFARDVEDAKAHRAEEWAELTKRVRDLELNRQAEKRR